MKEKWIVSGAELIAVLLMAVGFWQMAVALTNPSGYRLSSASAAQIAQVYSESTYSAAIAIMFFVLGTFVLLFATSKRTEYLGKRVKENQSAIERLSRIFLKRRKEQ